MGLIGLEDELGGGVGERGGLLVGCIGLGIRLSERWGGWL